MNLQKASWLIVERDSLEEIDDSVYDLSNLGKVKLSFFYARDFIYQYVLSPSKKQNKKQVCCLKHISEQIFEALIDRYDYLMINPTLFIFIF
jgi:hypothetical protein